MRDRPRSGLPRRFPPEQVAAVKAIACELPATHGLPLSRFSRTELQRLVIELAVSDDLAVAARRRAEAVAERGPGSTGATRSFAAKAAKALLDLDQRIFDGKRLRPDEYVISADEKSQLQALGRAQET